MMRQWVLNLVSCLKGGDDTPRVQRTTAWAIATVLAVTNKETWRSGFLWRVYPTVVRVCRHMPDMTSVQTTSRAVQQAVAERLRGQGHMCITDVITKRSSITHYCVHVRKRAPSMSFNSRSSPLFTPSLHHV
jgi:hypothetical protein